MGYERFSRDDDRRDRQDGGDARGRGGMGDFRDYDAAGESGDRYTGQGQRDFYSQRDYGQRDYGNQRYAQRDDQFGGRGVGGDRERAGVGYRGAYQAREEQRDRASGYTQPPEYHGSYASDGRRFEDFGRNRNLDDDYRRDAGRGRAHGGQPQGYDYQDRGFFQRAGDEVRSWFGDDEADRRRDLDARYDDRQPGGQHRDSDYHGWRSSQIDALDRDYDEYRRENRSKFENEFSTWRTARQGQRDSLSKVAEHMDVLGSDGEHVGTVDKVRGDRVILTRNDSDAGGRHHSVPSRWIASVDGKGVTLDKTAADAKRHWQDEERNQALFGDRAEGGERQNAGKTGATTY